MAEREHMEQAEAYKAIAHGPLSGTDYGRAAARMAATHSDMADMERILSRPVERGSWPQHTSAADHKFARERLATLPDRLTEAHAEYVTTMAKYPVLSAAYRDWSRGGAYVSNGSYRVYNENAAGYKTPGSRVAPWNRDLKASFPSIPSNMDFRHAATIYAAAHPGEIIPLRKPPTGYTGESKATSPRASASSARGKGNGEVKLPNGTYINRAEHEAAKQRAAYGGPVYRALTKNGSVEARSSDGARFRIVQHTNAFGLPAYDIIRHGETEPAAGYKGVIINRERLLDMTHGLTVARASRAKTKASA